MHIIIYRHGFHHINLQVSAKEFKKVVDDLSKEFEIHRNYIDYLGILEIYIINYCGDKEVIGLFVEDF